MREQRAELKREPLVKERKPRERTSIFKNDDKNKKIDNSMFEAYVWQYPRERA